MKWASHAVARPLGWRCRGWPAGRSVGQTVIGRTAYRGNFLPVFLCLCLALLWWGWPRPLQKWGRHGGVWWRIALAGACAGLLLYTYIPARFAPLLFFLFGLSFLLPYFVVARQNDDANSRFSGYVARAESGAN